jgi:PIN domain nuclease of toxin-antitoxin system
VRLLLDSHVLIWASRAELSNTVLDLIHDESNALYVSVAALWEIAIKSGSGKLSVPADLPERLDEMDMTLLPISAAHAWSVRNLPRLRHGDPFDRLMVAQAMAEGMTLVTHDRKLRDYGCELFLI